MAFDRSWKPHYFGKATRGTDSGSGWGVKPHFHAGQQPGPNLFPAVAQQAGLARILCVIGVPLRRGGRHGSRSPAQHCAGTGQGLLASPMFQLLQDSREFRHSLIRAKIRNPTCCCVCFHGRSIGARWPMVLIEKICASIGADDGLAVHTRHGFAKSIEFSNC